MKLSACQNDCVLDFESIANKKGRLCAVHIFCCRATATLTGFAVYIVTFILMKMLILLCFASGAVLLFSKKKKTTALILAAWTMCDFLLCHSRSFQAWCANTVFLVPKWSAAACYTQRLDIPPSFFPKTKGTNMQLLPSVWLNGPSFSEVQLLIRTLLVSEPLPNCACHSPEAERFWLNAERQRFSSVRYRRVSFFCLFLLPL